MLSSQKLADEFLDAKVQKYKCIQRYNDLRTQIIGLQSNIVDGRLIVERIWMSGPLDSERLRREYGSEFVDGFRKKRWQQVRVRELTPSRAKLVRLGIG